MGRVTDKIRQEVRPDVLVLSNRFLLRDWPPLRQEMIATHYPKQGLLNIYRA
jgi:hypothetical protein